MTLLKLEEFAKNVHNGKGGLASRSTIPGCLNDIFDVICKESFNTLTLLGREGL